MKINKRIEAPEAARVYWWVARYCPDNGEYEDSYTGSVSLGDLPRRVAKEVISGDGGTVYIVPDLFVVVYAKNAESLEQYKQKMDKDYIRWLIKEQYRKQEPFDFPD